MKPGGGGGGNKSTVKKSQLNPSDGRSGKCQSNLLCLSNILKLYLPGKLCVVL